MGRESLKDSPSSLLWVVCYYYNNGGEDEAGPDPLELVDESQFLGADGKTDKAALLRHIREQKQAEPPQESVEPDMRVRPVHLVVARFLQRRVDEARVAENLHLMPNGVPYNHVAAWRWRLWNSYLAGVAEEREARSGRG